MNKIKIWKVVVVLLLVCLAGCLTPTVHRHPEVYEEKGRPAWTYDENRVKEDFASDDDSLIEELNHPEKYYYFPGAQSVPVMTEEVARKGAWLDAINNFKAFLLTTGETKLDEVLAAGLNKEERREYQTTMNTIAGAATILLKPVRWYFEEIETPTIFGGKRIRWRAWCVVAFPKDRCAELYKVMFQKYYLR